MTDKDSRRFRRGASVLGRLGLAVVLSGLITAPAMSQDARPLSAGFSLAEKPGNEGDCALWRLGAELTPTAAGRTIVVLPKGGGENPFPPCPRSMPLLRSEAVKARKPPVSGGKVAVQILAGAASTSAAFWASVLTASESTLDDDEAMRRRATAWQLVGGAGLTPLVVYLVGNSGPQQGSLGKTYLYGAVGGAAGALLLFLAFESDTEALGYIAFAVSTLAPAVSAVIGFNSSRRYDPPAPVQTALLNMGQGKFRLGIPAPQIFFSGLGRKSPGLAFRIFQAEL